MEKHSLKNQLYPFSFFENLSNELHLLTPNFDRSKLYLDLIEDYDSKELMDVMRHVANTLHNYLPSDFLKSLPIITALANRLGSSFSVISLPEYVAIYGQNHLKESLEALKYLTQFSSAEFAIRVFLKNHFKQTLQEIHTWVNDPNEHVRRLASEGTRPRLPWSFNLDEVIKKPEYTLPILEALQKDNSLYVRKSVSNHLNDISKDNPEFLISEIKRWNSAHKHTSWIIKQGLRTLIKKGHSEALAILGFDKETEIETKLSCSDKNLKINNSNIFYFTIKNPSNKEVSLNIDFKIIYAGDKQNREKVFKLKNIILQPQQLIDLNKKITFKQLSTRKIHQGEHKFILFINGNEKGSISFNIQT